jgi:hypothetical protein
VLGGVNLSATDVDSPVPGLTYTLSGVTNGRFELSTAPGVAISSFTQAQLSAGQVRFVHNGSTNLPGYAVTVSDGALTDGPQAASVSFTVLPISPGPGGAPSSTTPVASDNQLPSQDIVLAAVTEEARVTSPKPQVTQVPFSPGRIEPPQAQPPIAEEALKGDPVRTRLPVATHNRYDAGPSIDPTLQLFAALPAPLEFLPTVPSDWNVQVAFPEADSGPREPVQVLMEQVRLGGMALSVGVVWWATRISGLLGSLLASSPAWRHIDPLPVVGRDEDDEKKWYDPNDRDADANELAIADVFEGAQASQSATRDHA